jgi:hypothetical protein
MRMAVVIAGALALGACASTGGPGGYAREKAALESDCTARGGMLTPLRGGTGRPATDFACEIRGGAGGLPR